MADLTDEQLLGYCALHCRTERALFHSSHLNRMLELAGYPSDYNKSVTEGWHSVHENTLGPLIRLAEERIRNA